jgi:diguanylate cyclase
MNLISTPQSPAAVAADLALPLRRTDFEAGLAQLLHEAVNGASRRELLTGLCQHLARTLRLRLALLAQRLENGAVTTDAASAENALWLEFQRIPERWDSGLTSRGPAGEALRAHAAVHMRLTDDGFALWRAAGVAAHVRELLALPVAVDGAVLVLELYFDGEISRGASSGTLTIAGLTRSIETFLQDLRAIDQQRLVARALSSAGNAAFITNLEGTIVWSNQAFSVLSGYSPAEVRGRNPNFLKSGEQGVRYYRDLWGTIRAGKVWSGEAVDRGKNGETYTIHQTVSPVSDDGRITHYVSIHQDVGRQKQARVELELASLRHPQTGLLTPAAFEDATRKALEAGEQACAFVVVSLRGLQRGASALGDDLEGLVRTAMGKRVRELVTAPSLCGMLGAWEYGLLLQGDVSGPSIEARLRTLAEKLSEPLPYLGEVPDLDIHFGVAPFPTAGRTFRELRLRAERLLADEPYRRARRDVN